MMAKKNNDADDKPTTGGPQKPTRPSRSMSCVYEAGGKKRGMLADSAGIDSRACYARDF
jgi:hypothetical protein